MKGLVVRLRLSRKALILIGGLSLLSAVTGSAAVLIGRDAILGPSYASVNGGACTDLQVVKLQRKNRLWMRKYVAMDESNGLVRARTALRVAKRLADQTKADLVQVVVVDIAGPTDRARIRGRAIGADVVYIPQIEQLQDIPDIQPLTVRYVQDGAAAGEFLGPRIELAPDEAEAMLARLTDGTDCDNPNGAAASDGHGASPKGKAVDHGGETPTDGGHGTPAAPADHGKGDPKVISQNRPSRTPARDLPAVASPAGRSGGSDAGTAIDLAEAEPSPVPASAPGLIASVKALLFGKVEPVRAPVSPAQDQPLTLPGTLGAILPAPPAGDDGTLHMVAPGRALAQPSTGGATGTMPMLVGETADPTLDVPEPSAGSPQTPGLKTAAPPIPTSQLLPPRPAASPRPAPQAERSLPADRAITGSVKP